MIPDGWRLRRDERGIAVEHPKLGGWFATPDRREDIANTILYRLANDLLAASECNVKRVSDGWIPVVERLPEQHRRAHLVYCAERQNTYTAYLDEGDNQEGFGALESCWRHFGGDGGFVHGVTHWMPVPAPPNKVHAAGTENG